MLAALEHGVLHDSRPRTSRPAARARHRGDVAMPFLRWPPRIPATKLVVPALPESSFPGRGCGAGGGLGRSGRGGQRAGRIGQDRATGGLDPRPPGPGSAWVTLDDDDNDPRRFWSAVGPRCWICPPCPARRRQRMRELVERPRGTDVVSRSPTRWTGSTSPVRLVLDNVHELVGREVLRDLTRLVHPGPRAAARARQPRRPADRSPASGSEDGLHEVRADALRFTLEETTALLRSAARVSPRPGGVLHERTEGWAAGLVLAAMALSRTDDTAAFLEDFSGDERSVAEYLTGEVLAR